MISSFLLLSLAFGGAGRGREAQLAALRPPPGWQKTAYSADFTAADLHKYLDGGAAKYLAYRIVELHVQEYRRLSDGLVATAEVYIMDSPQNAFGAYSCDRGGEHPAGLGAEASYEAGLLQFWQGKSYVRVYPSEPAGDESRGVLDLGAALSRALGSSGATDDRTEVASAGEKPGHGARGAAGPEGATALLPQIVSLMPVQGLIEDSLCFFHAQVSLNSIYYLSDENLLGLSDSTDAVSAEYRAPSETTGRVIAVSYPSEGAARRAYEAFIDQYLDPSEASPQSNEAHGDTGASGDETLSGRSVVDAPEQKPAGDRTEADSSLGQLGRAPSQWRPQGEAWGRAGEGQWLYAGLQGRYLALVFEAPTEGASAALGRTVLASLTSHGEHPGVESSAKDRENE
jgi:hypothetical protein